MWKYILLFLITIIAFGTNGSGVWENGVEEVIDSSWKTISVNSINSNTAVEIDIKDDMALDSTLFVAIRHYAIRTEPYKGEQYLQWSATTGSGNVAVTNSGQLNINYYGLDSIQVDSMRWGGYFWGDSIALYQLMFNCYEETDTSITQVIYVNYGDSLFIPAGSSTPRWASKIFTAQSGTSVDVFDYPFFMGSYKIYWRNRANAAANVRFHPPEIFLTAFYSK